MAFWVMNMGFAGGAGPVAGDIYRLSVIETLPENP
jgi:hypothetical protein